MERRNLVFYIIGLGVLLLFVLRLYNSGTDINVYLHASQQLLRGENIYTENPFNEYLYSPLFAWLLQPLAFFDLAIGRALWGVLNFFFLIRLGFLFNKLIDSELPRRQRIFWNIACILVAIGPVLHNIGLGQMTIFLLWLSLEGLFQILFKRRIVLGSVIVALGVAIKILPAMCAYFLFIKKRFAAAILTGLFTLIFLLLPSLFIGHQYNINLLKGWANKINPENSKYVFEDNRGTQSLNAILPTYFLDFGTRTERPPEFQFYLHAVPEKTLKIVLQVLRLLLVGSILGFIWAAGGKGERQSLRFLWEFSALSLVTILIFPHQQKYALLYMIPAASYFLYYFMMLYQEHAKDFRFYTLLFVNAVLFISTIWGRDVVGHYLVDFFDYFKIYGLFNIMFLIILWFLPPEHIPAPTTPE